MRLDLSVFLVIIQQIQKKTWIAERAGFRRYD
jgi:hypothetical protein